MIVNAVVLARLFLRQLPRRALAQLLRLRGDDREQRHAERTRLRLRERSGEPHGREPRLVEDLVGQSVSDPRDRALIREERLELAVLRFHGAPEPLVRQLASRGIRTEAPELQHVRGILGEPEPRPLFLSMLDQIEAGSVIERDARREMLRERRSARVSSLPWTARLRGGARRRGRHGQPARAHEMNHDRAARLRFQNQILAHAPRQAQELADEALGRGSRCLEQRGLTDQEGFDAAAGNARREVLRQNLEERQLRQSLYSRRVATISLERNGGPSGRTKRTPNPSWASQSEIVSDG